MKKFLIALGILSVTYFICPFIAGFFQIGDRDGPTIYSEGYHTPLYILGHELGNDGMKPRSSLAWMFMNRPIFYGMKRQFKSKEERQKILERLKKNGTDITRLTEFIEQDYDIDL